MDSCGAHVSIAANSEEAGRWAAAAAAQHISAAIADRGVCRVVFATGTSQIAMLAALCRNARLPWHRVEGFHLDEYLGIGGDHPASFQRYLRERILGRVPLGRFHFINGLAADPPHECKRLAALISPRPIDVALIGIGENGHLAFNDPPADFHTESPFLVVTLDRACRQQQVGEGWFPDIAAVPLQAITMSVRQILQARQIICCVPEGRKAAAVAAALCGPITPDVPASILQTHPHAAIFLDIDSAAGWSNS